MFLCYNELSHCGGFLSTIFIIKESKSMAKSKSAQTYELLKKNQAQLYEDFFHIHQLFSQDQAQHRQEFNRLGQDFVHWVRLYEKRLCGGMERSGHGAYSSSVADSREIGRASCRERV